MITTFQFSLLQNNGLSFLKRTGTRREDDREKGGGVRRRERDGEKKRERVRRRERG